MESNKSKILPISCICSIYYKTILKELLLSIDSLIIQEYIPSEIVIIVDGLIQEDVKSFLKDLIRNEKEIFKVFFLQENIGLGNALRFGIKKCHNSYIARFDTDDINLDKRLKIQYDFLNKNSNISIIGSNIFEFGKNLRKISIKNMPHKDQIKENSYMLRNPLNHPSVMFRKKDIIRIGSYKDIKFFEDYELWLRCLKSGLKIHNISESLVAMNREGYLKRRNGLAYALWELKFLKVTLKQKTIKKRFIPIYLIRIIIRFIPNRFSIIIKQFDLRRSNQNKQYFLENYINKKTNNIKSFSKKYN